MFLVIKESYKMKRIYLLLITIFLAISFVTAQGGICIDLDAPSPPILSAEVVGTNIILIWDSVIDVPDCSGIKHYEIWKNDIYLDETSDLTYTDNNVTYETYSYIVYAVDKAGHKTPSSEVTITLTATNPPVVTGTSGGSSGGGGGGNLLENNNIILTEEDNSNSGTGFEVEDEETEIIDSVDGLPNIFSRITGAVVGTLGTGGTIAIFVFVLGLMGTLIFIKIKKRK